MINLRSNDIAALVLALMVMAHPAAAGESGPSAAVTGESAQNCDTGGNPAAQRTRAATLAAMTWDVAAMSCAGTLYHDLAVARPADLELQVEAMTALNRLLHYLRIEAAADMYGSDQVLKQRLATASGQLAPLARTALAAAPENVPVMINAALAARFSAGAVDAALLGAAMARDPGALGGRAQIELGRVLYELPTIVGGDPTAAMKLLEQAVQVSPNDLQALCYLAEAYEQEMEDASALSVMGRMVDAPLGGADTQMAVDMLRLAAGLAGRMGDAGLSARLQARRQQLLQANPLLKTRASVAAAGHGGEHPLDQERR